MAWYSNIFRRSKALSTINTVGNNSGADIRVIGSGLPVWTSLNNAFDYLEAFNSIPEIAAIVTKSSEAFANGIATMYRTQNDKKTKVTANAFLKKMEYPNYLQDGREFMAQAYANLQIFGNCYIYVDYNKFAKNKLESVNALWVLPSQYITPILGTKLYSATQLTDIVEGYRLQYNGITDFPADNIIHINDINLDFAFGNYVIGKSRMSSLQKPVSTIAQAYEAQNVLLAKRGAIGILSQDGGDQISSSPLTKSEIQKIQDEYQKYGLSRDQWQIIITAANMKWQPITSNIKDLMISESIKQATQAICDVYNFPYILFSEGSQTTFDNQNTALTSLYTNKIRPESKRFSTAFEHFFGMQKQGLSFEIDFSHIEYLQADMLLEAQKQRAQMDIILAANQAVKDYVITYDIAVNMLVMLANIDIDTAKTLIKQPQTQTAQPQSVEMQSDVAKAYMDIKNLIPKINGHAVN